MDNSDVYYKIYYLEKKDYVTVVTMQWFDEGDYTEEYFFKDDQGKVLRFDYEYEAVQWLKDNITEDKLDPEYKHIGFNQKKFMKIK